jgi:hypothetical protein
VQELRVINDDLMGGKSCSRLLRTATGLLISEGQSGPFRVELELPRAG